LSDYSNASQNKWNIQLLLKDFTQTNYQAKLRITIEGAGIRLRSRQGFIAGPIRLDPGIPYQVDATDLSQYLNIQNMEVSGINRNQLASTQKLPEGFYQFKIEVLDYNRNNRVSNIGTSIAWLVLNDPPLLNLPFEEKLRIQDPQQVQFQWTPRHTSSPTSAFETEYIFKLWEIWPEGRNPNEVARTTQPLFETTIMTTSYFYGLNDAMLIPGRSYAWQVQAINLSGRDLFNNQGKSEVKSFQYGDACQPITNLGAEAMGTDRIRISWQGEWNHNRYVAQIREKGEENWFNYGTNLETQVVYDLQADTEYEIRVIPSCGAIDGAAENVLTLKTLEQEIQDFDCGAEPNRPEITNQEPIEQLQIGDRITAAGFTVILTQLNQMGDTYSGRGLIEVPLFNGARVEANLNNITVNTDKQLISGNIESTYNPNGPFIIGLDKEEPDLSEEGTGNQEEGEEDSFDELPEPDITIGGEIADVIVDDEDGTITVIDSEGNETELDPETADENEDGDIAIEDDEGNVWVVDDGGNVSGPHINEIGKGRTANQSDQEEELIIEILQYLEQTITAWQSDNSTNLQECIPKNNDLLNPVLELSTVFQDRPGDLLTKYSTDDKIALSENVDKYNETDNPSNYQEVLSEESWLEITCRAYSYLNDLAQGVGEVEGESSGRLKIENLINGYRTAYKQGFSNFTAFSATFGDVNPTDYYIEGVSSITVGLIDNREENDYEPEMSTDYVFDDVSGQIEIEGFTFENSAVFQFFKPNRLFSDPPKFIFYGYHSEVDNELNSKKILRDYLPGKYDYKKVQNFINRIINSHDKGEETLNMVGELSNKQVYARNVDFGDKGIYDLYISRTGDFSNDISGFYNYNKNSITEIFSFTGAFTQYRIVNESGGITSISLPTSQSERFENSVLKLHSKNSGKAHVDLINAIRAANLNADTELDITEYGVNGGKSPLFEINHDGEKLKLMVFYPSGIDENKIDPSNKPSQSSGEKDNIMGKAGSYVVFEFQNESVDDTGHNMYIYVLETQIELFESYLLITEDVLITGINWRSQVDSYFENEGCYDTNDGNVCCRKACDVIIEQFGVQTNRSHSIDIAVLTSPDTDYNSLSVTDDFESGLKYLKSTIKPNQQGGKPVLVGVHYNRGKKPFNINKATYHFIVIVGKGYDRKERKHYFRFYDVNTSNRSEATSESNKLYIEETQHLIRGARGSGRTYTITEVRKNF
jgi:hypothetical protein